MDENSACMIKLKAWNYAIWKSRMEDLLFVKDLHEPIEGDAVKPEKMSDKEWIQLHRKCVGTIRQWIDQSVFHHVAKETKADVMWRKLESIYEQPTPQNKANLMKRLVNLKYKEGRSIAEHTSEFQGLVNQLTTMNISLDDELQALLLLSSLPDSWETLVVSVNNSAPNGKLTVEMVKDRMQNEEARRKNAGMSSSETETLVTEKHERRGRSQSRSSGNNNYRGRSKSQRKNVKCYHCNKIGHIKRECRIWKREQAMERGESQKNEQVSNTVVADGDMTIVYDENSINLTCHTSDWVIDSGASFHVTSNCDFFTSYASGDFGYVRMGNDGASKIVGIGDIYLESSVGSRLLLKDVRHVPEMRLNLISTGKLDDDGYCNYFGEGKWKLTKGSIILAKGRKVNTLYVMEAKLIKEDVNVAAKESDIELWHKRLGHISEKGLQVLVKKNFLPSFTGKSLKPCDHCLAGKAHRVAFRNSYPSRRANLLDLIHTDVCTMQTRTRGGALYFVTFIDDCSRKVWIFALKSKDQVLDVFKDFHVKVERGTGRQLKCVRADNGGEYRGPFEQYCRSHGIRLEKTVPKTPQQNGVAERMNRTIQERIRCMLSDAKLPKYFWGEAMRTAVDLINLSPSAPLDDDVPERVWTGKDVSYKHLRVFGCRAFVHIPKDERSKLDNKARECIFLGYAHEDFGYRLWDLVSHKIIRSRDVTFLEDQIVDGVEKDEKPQECDEIPIPDTSRSVLPPVVYDDYGGDAQEDFDDRVDDDGPAEQVEQAPPESFDPPVEPQLRRSMRERHHSSKYPPHEYVMLTDGGEPENFHEVMSHQHKNEWFKAMQEEIKSLHENHTYELAKLPKGKRALKNK